MALRTEKRKVVGSTGSCKKFRENIKGRRTESSKKNKKQSKVSQQTKSIGKGLKALRITQPFSSMTVLEWLILPLLCPSSRNVILNIF